MASGGVKGGIELRVAGNVWQGNSLVVGFCLMAVVLVVMGVLLG